MNFKDQKAVELRTDCKKAGTLFTDPEFPAQNESLAFDKTKLAHLDIRWMRPQDICTQPRFLGQHVSPTTAHQGRLGNCWFVAACACLVLHQSVLRKVLISPWYDNWDEYCGVFEFRFWRFGEWTNVVVDDLLPTLDGELLYCHAYQTDEFWCSLLEKAYAKLLGSYEALEGGELADALVDFTGGFTECLDIYGALRLTHIGTHSGLPQHTHALDSSSESLDARHHPEFFDNMFNLLSKYHLCGSLIAAAISAECADDQEKETDLGLVIGHAYAVVRICALPVQPLARSSGDTEVNQARSIRLVRLTNPWGHGQWRGAFSRNSADWNLIDPQFVHASDLGADDHGDFWMRFEDFLFQFNYIVLCHTAIGDSWFRFTPQGTTDALSHCCTFVSSFQPGISTSNPNCTLVKDGVNPHPARLWREIVFHSSWSVNSSGGCLNYLQTFHRNPQFVFDILHSTGASVALYLMQKTTRSVDRSLSTTGLYHIGLCLFRVEGNRTVRLESFDQAQFLVNSLYRNSRTVWIRLYLDRGRYCVIPTTFYPNCHADFMLRFVGVPPISAFELQNNIRLLEAPVPRKQSVPKRHRTVTTTKAASTRRVVLGRRVRSWFSSLGELLQWDCSVLGIHRPIPMVAELESVLRVVLHDVVLQPLSVASVAFSTDDNANCLPTDGDSLITPSFYARLIHDEKTVETGIHRSELSGRPMAHGVVRFGEAFIFDVNKERADSKVVCIELFIKHSTFDEFHCRGTLTLPNVTHPIRQIHQIALFPTNVRSPICAFLRANPATYHLSGPLSQSRRPIPHFDVTGIFAAKQPTILAGDETIKVCEPPRSLNVACRSAFCQSELLLEDPSDSESASETTNNDLTPTLSEKAIQRWNDGRCGVFTLEITRLYVE